MDTPASRLLIYGTLFTILVAMAFGFFAMTGGGVRSISGRFGLGLGDVIYDTPAAGGTPVVAPRPGGAQQAGRPRPLPEPVSRPPEPEPLREPSVPETKAEEQYYAAIQKATEIDQRQAQRLKGRDEVLRFLETPLGRDFRAVAELARRGRTREARDYLRKVLGAMNDSAPRIQAYALKLAIHVYKVEKDQAGVSWALKRYLEVTRDGIADRGTASETDKDASGSLVEVENLLRRAQSAAGGGGRQ